MIIYLDPIKLVLRNQDGEVDRQQLAQRTGGMEYGQQDAQGEHHRPHGRVVEV